MLALVLRSFPIQYPMTYGLPTSFAPEQILFREISFNNTPGEFHFVYGMHPKPLKIEPANGSTEIEKFIKDAVKADYQPASDDLLEDDQHLNLCVRRDSYIVLKLDKDLNWSFNDLDPAFTLGSAQNQAYYGYLNYVDSAGAAHRPADTKSGSPFPNCRLIYFAARDVEPVSPQEPSYQPMNINVQLNKLGRNPTKPTPITIDPDIRNPGTGSP